MLKYHWGRIVSLVYLLPLCVECPISEVSLQLITCGLVHECQHHSVPFFICDDYATIIYTL